MTPRLAPNLTIALLQLAPCGPHPSTNLEKGLAACRAAQAQGADVALFPEMWSTGYAGFDLQDEGQRRAWEAQALSLDSPFVRAFQEEARQLGMAVALTLLERWPGGPRNTLVLFDRWGQPALTYAKAHPCAFDWEAALTPGEDFPVCTLDTAQGQVRVGAMICFDREFPESARLLTLNGAELILVPNACRLEGNRLAQFRARAFENMTALAMTNYPAPQENGASLVLDGRAFAPDGASRDMIVTQAGAEEGIFLASLDLESLRGYREHEVWLAYRRPHLYTPLSRPSQL